MGSFGSGFFSFFMHILVACALNCGNKEDYQIKHEVKERLCDKIKLLITNAALQLQDTAHSDNSVTMIEASGTSTNARLSSRLRWMKKTRSNIRELYRTL